MLSQLMAETRIAVTSGLKNAAKLEVRPRVETVVFPRLGVRVGNTVFTGMKVETFRLSITVLVYTSVTPLLKKWGTQHTFSALSMYF